MTSHAKEEAEIRALIEAWADAVRRKDEPRILAHHAADMTMFDVPPPPMLRGLDAYARTWPLFYKFSPDPPRYEIRELAITAGADVAFAVALMRCQTLEEGSFVDLDFRLTIGLKKADGQWTVTHEHHSVPASE